MRLTRPVLLAYAASLMAGAVSASTVEEWPVSNRVLFEGCYDCKFPSPDNPLSPFNYDPILAYLKEMDQIYPQQPKPSKEQRRRVAHFVIDIF